MWWLKQGKYGLAAFYAVMVVFTYGSAAARADRDRAACEAADKADERAAFAAGASAITYRSCISVDIPFFDAVGWPLYWSWRLQS